MDILWTIFIGIVVGWLAGLLVKGRGFGMIGDLVVGIIGALVGSWIFGALGITTTGDFSWFLMAVVGAVIFLAAVKVIRHA